jgi:cobalt/nickel transport system permease protein
MHIPDGFLDAKTSLATAAISFAGLAVALHHTRKNLPPRKVPLLGLSAAFVFAAQMINFPVAGGTSGHLLGGVLTAALLGPSAAVIVLSTVLIVQCLAFADGGITALGANIFNMAIVASVGGWMVYALLCRFSDTLKSRLAAAVLASWLSAVLASIACAGELATSHTVSWTLAFPAMTSVHALIGIGEGIITALVLSAIASVRPELVLPARTPYVTPSLRPLLIYGFLAALGLGLFVAPFACQWPDGLDKVAQTLGFDAHLQPGAAPLADYKIPGLSSPLLATALAAVVGTVLVFSLGLVVAKSLVLRKAVK